MQLKLSELKRLSTADLARITELNVLPSWQTEMLIDDVREKLLWSWRHGGWHDPAVRESQIVDTINFLVPQEPRTRWSEFSLITAAWEFVPDLRKASRLTWTEMTAVAGTGLTGAYGRAVRNLVQWVEDRQNQRKLNGTARS